MQKYFSLVLLAVSFIWLRSGTLKVLAGDFPQNLGQTLTMFAKNNPYPWYKDILLNFSIPNSYVFGFFVMYGEVFAGFMFAVISLLFLLGKKLNTLLTVLLGLALCVGMTLNLTFWLASGHLSPAGDSINLLMFFIQLIGFMYVVDIFRKKEAI